MRVITEAGQRWTRERPTEPGWYWFRQTKGAETVVAISAKLQLLTNLCPQALTGTSTLMEVPVDLLDGEFQGPLNPTED